jgi:hypothetical protein
MLRNSNLPKKTQKPPGANVGTAIIAAHHRRIYAILTDTQAANRQCCQVYF